MQLTIQEGKDKQNGRDLQMFSKVGRFTKNMYIAFKQGQHDPDLEIPKEEFEYEQEDDKELQKKAIQQVRSWGLTLAGN